MIIFSRYTGEWRNNTKTGNGAMFYSNGDIFSGSWEEEKKEDEGMYQYASGSVFDGWFHNGKIEKGTFSMITDFVVDTYTGEYVKGVKKTGTYDHSNGDQYEGKKQITIIKCYLLMTEGEFEKLDATCSDQNTAQYSTGKYVWACGKIFEGSFKCGKMSYGTLTNLSKVNLTNNFFLLRSWSNILKGLEIRRIIQR